MSATVPPGNNFFLGLDVGRLLKFRTKAERSISRGIVARRPRGLDGILIS